MKPYPHSYTVTAKGSASGAVSVVSTGLPAMATAPPPVDAMGGLVHANIVRIIAERNLTDWR